MADLASYVPSMVDGLKRGQRKVLFCSFKRNFVEEAFVTELIGYASAHSAYSKQSLASIIIGMAQDFVGSNNISLLEPQGLLFFFSNTHERAYYMFIEEKVKKTLHQSLQETYFTTLIKQP